MKGTRNPSTTGTFVVTVMTCSQSVGRQILPVNVTAQVFHGDLPTNDVVLLTPFQYVSDVRPYVEFLSIVMNVTRLPRLGNLASTDTVFADMSGVSFNLKTVFNPYTKVVTEAQNRTFIEYLVAIFSVFGKMIEYEIDSQDLSL